MWWTCSPPTQKHTNAKRPKDIENRCKHMNTPNKRKWTMHFGCWHVHRLTKKIQEILSELQKLNTDVAILSEANKNGKGDKYLEDFIHFRSWVNKGKRENARVSIIINKKYKKHSSRMDIGWILPPFQQSIQFQRT
jgi:hypothetical protein